MKRIILVLCGLLLVASMTLGATITLTLTDTINPVGTRYYCYHRMTTGSYGPGDRADLGTSKVYNWVMNNPALGTHYFACTAYIMDGAALMESSFSNEFSWVNGPAAPTLSGMLIAVNRKDATLLAKSSTPMTTALAYGTARKPYSKTITVSGTPALEHTITLTKLTAKTRYLYRWTGRAADGSEAVFEGTFTTT